MAAQQQALNVMWHSSDPLKFKSIKTFILILSLFFGQILLAQTNRTNADFYFRYSVSGLGSNMGSLMPTLEIHKSKFVYKKEQNSYYVKRSKNSEFISSGFIRQSSIDSILLLVNKIKDSAIYKINPCIMSGGITYVTIAQGTDTTKFTLRNTSDYVVLKIVDILNPYLPYDKQLYESIEEIKNEEECWASLRERVEMHKSDSLKAKQ